MFLNHGSFGACPKPVFEAYQRWQLELERQPVEFLGRRVNGLLDDARVKLATYLNCPVDDLVFVPNATSGVNVAARSLALQPGDEILTSDHEYGACSYTWQHNCERTGAKYVIRSIRLPLTTPEAFVEDFWAGVTARTRRNLPESHRIADGADLSGGGNLPEGAWCGDYHRDRRGARAGANSTRLREDWRGFLHGELP